MHRKTLEAYAQKARRDFIAAVTDRAAFYGLTANSVEPVVEKVDVILIGAHAFPLNAAAPRRLLEDRVRRDGFEQVMEAMAYTWFNRFAAIRYMELHGYLDHGYRVLSHPEGRPYPEILEYAADVDLPDLDREKVVELKLDGGKDEELYRSLLLAQCNALHEAMPFLFERIGDETELLLPANLLHTGSLIRQMVECIDESAWERIEIIGWLYQFYISEKKGQVIGKVVAAEDIPAATQLFTPNWIVKYLVQNSLGAQWLATYPHSSIRGRMDYYIEPAEQADEVKAQIAAITPGTLDPEALTLIDPACGSGHILVEAYELFRAIYLERGYRRRDAARLILEKNLFGLDIDGRAAQLTGFALMMKGRADDHRFFERSVTLNVMPLVDSTGFDAEDLAHSVKLSGYGLAARDLTELKRLFEHAATFGSLIQVPEPLAAKLPALKRLSEKTSHDLFVEDTLKHLALLVRQAEMLAGRYDSVVANPPYMGSKFHIPILKKFLKDHCKGYEKDVFSAFIDRDLAFSKPHGRLGFMSPFVWMFISSHEHLRKRLIDKETITSLVQLEYSGFEGATVPICTFTLQKGHVASQKGCFIRLSDFRGSDSQAPRTLEAIQNRDCGWFFEAAQNEFKKIPGSPVAYWVSERLREVFEKGTLLGNLVDVRQGLATADNDQFLRRWHEVDQQKCSYDSDSRDAATQSGKKWFPHNKGGTFRKWYGNQEYLVNWEHDGRAIRAFGTENGGRARSRAQNTEFYFRESLTWSEITSGPPSFRVNDSGGIHNIKGMSAFSFRGVGRLLLAGYCNTPIVLAIARATNPTLSFPIGYFVNIPFIEVVGENLSLDVTKNVNRLVRATRTDWNVYERSWDFESLPILMASSDTILTIESSYSTWIAQNRETIAEMKHLEEENNHLFINAYGLQDELAPDVPIEQITLTVNPACRYGGNLTEEEQWTRFRRDTMAELVSYAIGCMMGRYSLDAPGLIYARSGGTGFDPGRYTTFPADPDGIIPLTDSEWFDDDAAHRLVEFVSVAWDDDRLEDNLSFLADNLNSKKNESSRDTLRRYLCDSFFKDHLQTYKKPHLLVVQQWQEQGLSVPRLPAPLQRRHAGPDAYRVRDPAAGHDGFSCPPVGGGP
ncbi:MAG: BREX-1 system adenine-specific DNA-methyltransferase PglX [Bryobacterales bacterium]|nr:BREX-1 system adenine-specific DNA-methyltransferase PglX [Bryobacterales bacterium]